MERWKDLRRYVMRCGEFLQKANTFENEGDLRLKYGSFKTSRKGIETKAGRLLNYENPVSSQIDASASKKAGRDKHFDL